MSLQFLYAGLTSMATFYIQYAVTVYLENPFSRNPHVTCPSKIDDGVRLGSRDRVIVLLVSGVKTSLLKKRVYTCINLECAFHYFTAFSCEQILFTKLKLFLLVLFWNMVNVFLWIIGDVIIFFFISICLSWFKPFRKKKQIWTFNIFILRHWTIFLLPVQDFLLDPFGDLPNCYFR